MGPTEPEDCPGPDRPGWRGPLETARLRLRSPRNEDAERVSALLSDWRIVGPAAKIPHPFGISDARDFFAQAAKDTSQGKGFAYLIEDRARSLVIGGIGATIDGGVADLGYWIDRTDWGKGFATEALRRIVRMVFGRFGASSVKASVMSGNLPSRRVLEKCGFAIDAASSPSQPANEERFEPDIFKLSREAWKRQGEGKPILFVVAAALIDSDNRVLLARRPPDKSMAGLWEFPGGKMQSGETPEAALIRELNEELGIDVSESCLAPITFASHDYDTFHLVMPVFACRKWRGAIQPREGQIVAWVRHANLADYPMPPADIPLVAMLGNWL
jgi:8-oxo-dGTP diphosphatase